MDMLRQDLRYAVRRVFRSPGFSLIAIVTLALGIGANSAIFSVVDGVLLKPLPYPQPDRLVGVYHVSDGHRTVMSGPNFIDVVHASRTLESAAAIQTDRVILTGQGEPVRLNVAQVSASLFDVLRVRPILGRGFEADENTPGKTGVVVLGYGLWQERFGGEPSVIGRRIQLDGVAKEVVGVMPAGFSYPEDRAAWLPIVYDHNFVSAQRSSWYLQVVGRLKPGVSDPRAAAEVQTIGRNLARAYPDDDGQIGMTTMPLRDAMVGDVRRAVLVLFGAVGFVLLIACANVANLLMARAAARENEMAVRAALGAARYRLLRQLVTETVLLSLLGGALGLLLAVWGVDLLLTLQPQGIPRLHDVRVDGVVAAFTFAIAALTGLVFGLVPAFHATRAGVSNTLKEGGRGALGTRGGARTRSALVVVEMALAVMLLAGAGLLIRSFARLQSVDPGFSSNRTLTFELTLPEARYAKDATRVLFFDQLFTRLRALPGVQAADAVMGLPLTGMDFDISFQVAGRPPLPPAQEPSMEVRVASAGYFRTVGIPLRRGRFFTDDDRPGSPQVVLLTGAAVRQYFPHEDPIGKTITLGWGRTTDHGHARAGGKVVGIVGDVKDDGLNEANPPEIYLPLRQWPVDTMTVVVRTAVPPQSLADAVRGSVHEVDPNMPVSNLRTLDEIVARSISQPRFYMLLLAIFAAVALVLAAIGIFGVLSYAVAQRTREIGIRMALGAQAGSVMGLVVRQAMLLAGTGILAGTIAALALSRALQTLLFEVPPHDPSTFAAVAALLGGVAFAASYLPARRAARVDPIVALRAE